MVKSITSVQLKTITDVGVQRVRNISSKIILEDGETVKVTKETLLIVTLFFFCKFLIDHNWIGPLKTQKTELDQYQGHRNLIRMYNNTYIIMLP